MMTSAPILRHLAVEDPRPFAPVLARAGDPLHEIEPSNPLPDPVEPDLIALTKALRQEARAQGPAPKASGQAAFGHWLRELDG
ncbi:Glutamine amidotransferase class-I [Cereibacter sphaeroides KD131]|nr:Glutamine amidotransferase class-I [Cereibacter sphaeroides KD131]